MRRLCLNRLHALLPFRSLAQISRLAHPIFPTPLSRQLAQTRRTFSERSIHLTKRQTMPIYRVRFLFSARSPPTWEDFWQRRRKVVLLYRATPDPLKTRELSVRGAAAPRTLNSLVFKGSGLALLFS